MMTKSEPKNLISKISISGASSLTPITLAARVGSESWVGYF